jgi:hypothetical protein
MLILALLLTSGLAPCLVAPLCFDRVLLKDGRSIECTLIESPDPAFVRIKIKSVEIPIRADLVDKSWVENLENYVPKNAQEEEYLKKGFVLFEGSWMSSKRREGELKKRADADKSYIDTQKKRQDWRNAVTIDTRHFTVKSNLEDALLKMYTDNLEAYYKSFVDYWGITLSPGEKGKPHVFLYRTWYDYFKATGMPPFVLGFFSPVTMELHLFHNPDKPNGSLEVMFHEGNHLLTHLMSPTFRYPIWMNEGMAEFYGTAKLDERGRFVVGGQQDGRIVGMRQERTNGKFRKLTDVLVTEQGDFDAYDYGYAWSFTHYLMTSPKYGSAYRAFFANLSENKDLEIKLENIYGYDRAAIGQVQLDDVVDALERRLGKPLTELETEWLAYFDTAYGELGPEAYYRAALMALRKENDTEPDVKAAMDYYQKAVELGIQDASCFRDYAEMLRKGGIREGDEVNTPLKPDQAKAWEMIQKAIELDPIGPLNYCEAAGILILDGPAQDLDKAADFATTAVALAGPRNTGVKSLHDELMALVEPARAKREAAAEAAAEAVKNDNRKWHVAFYYLHGQEPPANLANISTDELRELVRSGKVTGRDSVFQSYQAPDPESGKPVIGDNPWDKDWVKVRDCTLLAEELAAADAPTPKAGGAAAADAPPAPADDPPANPAPPADGG